MNIQESYLVSPEGVHKLNATFLGQLPDLGRIVAADARVTVKNIVDLAIGGASYVVSVTTRHGKQFTATRLPFLNLRTQFKAQEDTLVPSFVSRDGTLTMTRTWAVPECMTLIFGTVSAPPEGGTRHKVASTFLFATLADTPGFWRLPLPNVYNDARVCMGSITIEEPTLLSAFTRALEHFHESPWNADLLTDQAGAAERLFRFPIDPEAPAFAPSPDHIKDTCTMVSHPYLENFIL
jgi:hypothetical protein